MLCVLPVVGVVISVARRRVDIISNQPVEALVATDTDALHVPLGDVQAVRIEVAQDHHVLQHNMWVRHVSAVSDYFYFSVFYQ